ncbi:MAG: hypothetical protein H6977_04070 [Gammaproteobacteria bacterium]|nr:hypothetical protein [Gammaproteobacteria bacterium]
MSARPPRRIALALSSGALPTGAAALLRQLGGTPGDELHVLFIEDSELLKAVALPFTVEFCAVTSVRRPIDAAALEGWFRREAATAQRELSRLAETCGLKWRFEVVRETPRAALGRVLAQLDEALLLPPPAGDGKPASAPIVALVDASPAGERALEIARVAAAAEQAPLEPHHLDPTDDPAALVTRMHGLLARDDARLTVVAAPLLGALGEHAADVCAARHAPLLILR